MSSGPKQKPSVEVKQSPPVAANVVAATNNNESTLQPNTEINKEMQGLRLQQGPTVTVIPPVLHVSHPPEQDGSNSSSSEYESFPDTSSDREDHANDESEKSQQSFSESCKPVEEHQGLGIEKGKDPGEATGQSSGQGMQREQVLEGKEWVPPDVELQEKIVKQVEFYFSDANITKDAFLLKHVRRNKHGFVSIKLISSFKKIRKLTKDWKAVSHSLKELSQSLEVNAEGTKVKRKHALPDIDLSTPLRTVVVVNLPDENPSVETVTDMFKHCGKIVLVRIVRPNKPFPPDVQRHIPVHREIGDRTCALVEFEKADAAQKAVKTMNSEYDWRSGLSVMLLAKEGPKKKSKDKQKDAPPGRDVGSLSGGDADVDKGKQRKRKNKKNKNRVDELSHDGGLPVTPSSSDCENSPSPNRRYANKPIPIPNSQHLSPSGTPKSSPCPSPHGSPRGQRKFHSGRSLGGSPHSGSPHSRGGIRGTSSPQASPELRRKVCDKSDKEGQSDSSNSPSPWVQRRRMLAAQNRDASPGSSPMLTRRMIDPTSGAKPQMSGREGVLRLPRGPEPEKGFYEGKGRGHPISS